MSVSQVSVGSFVRPSDTEPLAKIVYMASVYVAFTVPQRNLADLQQALAARTATIDVIIPGASKPPPARSPWSITPSIPPPGW